MAEETLDAAVQAHGLSAEPCKTVGLMLEGAKGWTPTFYIRLVQDYGLEQEVRPGHPIRASRFTLVLAGSEKCQSDAIFTPSLR